jgi:hypothetical protein
VSRGNFDNPGTNLCAALVIIFAFSYRPKGYRNKPDADTPTSFFAPYHADASPFAIPMDGYCSFHPDAS